MTSVAENKKGYLEKYIRDKYKKIITKVELKKRKVI
jgi:hypothetical protein